MLLPALALLWGDPAFCGDTLLAAGSTLPAVGRWGSCAHGSACSSGPTAGRQLCSGLAAGGLEARALRRWVLGVLGGQRCPVLLLAWAELLALRGVYGQQGVSLAARLHLAVPLGSEGAPGIRQVAGMLTPNPSTPTRCPGGAAERGQTSQERGQSGKASTGKVGNDAGGNLLGPPALW